MADLNLTDSSDVSLNTDPGSLPQSTKQAAPKTAIQNTDVSLQADTPAPNPLYDITPNEHGYFVPNQQQLTAFDQFQASGGDVTQLPEKLRASFYLAKGGDPLATFDTFKTLIADPAKEQQDTWNAKPLPEKIGDVWNNTLGFLNAAKKEIWSIPGALVAVGNSNNPDTDLAPKKNDTASATLIKAAGAGVQKAANEFGDWGSDWINATGAALTGHLDTAQKFYDASVTHANNMETLITNGAAKGVADASGLIYKAAMMTQGINDWFNSQPGGSISTDPTVRARAQQNLEQLNYQTLKAERDLQNGSDNFYQNIVQGLATAGAISQPDAQKLSQNNITPQQTAGASAILNPLNFLPELRGLGVAGKPAFIKGAEEFDAQIVSKLAAKSQIETKLGALTDPTTDEATNLIAARQDLDRQISQLGAAKDNLVASGMKEFQRSVGPANQIAGNVLQGASKAIGVTQTVTNYLNKGVSAVLDKLAPPISKIVGPDVTGAAFKYAAGHVLGNWLGLGGLGPEAMVEGLAGGLGGHALSYAVGNVADWAKETALGVVGLDKENLVHTLSVLGKETALGESTLPFWQRVNQGYTDGEAPWLFRQFGDSALAADITKTVSGVANSSLKAGTVNAVIGGIAGGGDYKALGSSFGSGALFGAAGGFGVWHDVNSPEQLQAEAVGDRFRFVQSLKPEVRQQFERLSPATQLTLGSFFNAHPDVELRFDAEPGSGGNWLVNTKSQRGVISIDPTMPDGAINAAIQHEFAHSMLDRGILPELKQVLLGDESNPGLLSKADLEQLRNQLADKYARAGFPDENLTDDRVIHEIAAEHAVSLLGPADIRAARPTLLGKLLDQGVNPLLTPAVVKDALGRLGNGFDKQNNIVGTGLFTANSRIAAVDSILKDWYSSRKQFSRLQAQPDAIYRPSDFAKKSDAEIRAVTGGNNLWKTDTKGNIVRDSNGAPVLKPDSLVDREGRAFGNYLAGELDKLVGKSHDGAFIKEADGSYSISKLPTTIKNGLGKTGILSPEQLANLERIEQAIADRTSLKMVYQPAYTRGRNQQPVPGAFPAKTMTFTPTAIKLTKAKNWTVQGWDSGQLFENIQDRIRQGDRGAMDWNADPQRIYGTAKQVAEKLASGGVTTDVVLPHQKTFVHELFGLNPKSDGREIFADIPKSERSESVLKTPRLDRINRVFPVAGEKWNLESDPYQAFKDYRTPGQAGGYKVEQPTPMTPKDRTTYGISPAISAAIGQDRYDRNAMQGAKNLVRNATQSPQQPTSYDRSKVPPKTQRQQALVTMPVKQQTEPRNPDLDLEQRHATMIQMKPANREQMAQAIVNLEAERDRQGRLIVAQLPPGDKGGSYEVAGINDRFDSAMAPRLAYLVRNGKQPEAESEARNYIANQTDSVYGYFPNQKTADASPAVQFYLRDTMFHQGEGGMRRILARAMGFNPKYITPQLVAQAAKQPGFVDKLKNARKLYIQMVQQPPSNLYQGLMNRTERAEKLALAMR